MGDIMRLVRGVGRNDSDYEVNPGVRGAQKMCTFYKTWMNMLNRVYSPRKVDKSYEGCVVYDKWLSFMSFRAWMEGQDWEGKQLDKDLITQGNKIYGPETCCFISRKLNCAISRKESKRLLPTGVYKTNTKASDTYEALFGEDGKVTRLGVFDSVYDAELEYLKHSYSYIIRVAKESDTKEVIEVVEKRFGAKLNCLYGKPDNSARGNLTNG